MMNSGRSVLEVPNEDPTTYCRLCLSMADLRVLDCQADHLELVQVIWTQLGIQLSGPDDFPCAVCELCVEKLEELFESNNDGLLDEWEDEGLMAFKEDCRSVDAVIRNRKPSVQHAEQEEDVSESQMQHSKTVVLPFQQLSDGRYKCNECANVVFHSISDCLRHYQEGHPNSSATGLSSGKNDSASHNDLGKRFDCLIGCGAQLGTLEELTAHQNTHLTPEPQKRKSVPRRKPPAATNGSHGTSTTNVPTGKKPCLKCINCSETFDDVDELIKHRTDVHAVDFTKKKNKKHFIMTPNSTVCKECQVDYVDKKSFYMHISTAHDLNICYICDKTVPPSSNMVKHLSYHRNLDEIINPYLQAKSSYHCKVCFKKFRTEGEIRYHFEMQHANSEDPSPGLANGTTTTSAAVASWITCTKCFISCSSEQAFEQHQTICVARDAGTCSIATNNEVVELSDEEIVGGA